jgi:hypothetical protein
MDASDSKGEDCGHLTEADRVSIVRSTVEEVMRMLRASKER